MFYILLFFALSITISCLQLGTKKIGFSKPSTVVMIAIPSLTWTYIIWQEYTPSNFYVGLVSVVVIFESALFVSGRLVMRWSRVMISAKPIN